MRVPILDDAEAAAAGAVCIDGSTPAYLWRPGSRPGRLLLGLMGGGMCNNPAECFARSHDFYGSTTRWPAALDAQDITSGRPERNPAFHDWDVAYLIYCDGTQYLSLLLRRTRPHSQAMCVQPAHSIVHLPAHTCGTRSYSHLCL